MENKQYLIIITTGKSGSLLLLSLFDWHPEVLVFPFEENLVDQWISIQEGKVSIDKHINTQSLSLSKLNFKDVLEWYIKHRLYFLDMSDERAKARKLTDGIDLSNINYSTFVSKLTDLKKSEIDIAEWLNDIFDAYKGSVKKYEGINPKYFAFKTINPGSFKRYTDILPKAKFIHLVRHPYDIFNSIKRNQIINKKINYFRGDYDLLEYIMEKNFVPLFDNINTALSSKEQHYVVKYEDIVSNPKEATKKLCEWLHISWNDNMTVPTLAGEPFLGYSENRKVKHDGVVNPQRVNVFKETLGNTEVRLVDYLFHNMLQHLGYSMQYGTSCRNRLGLILGLMLPLKFELKNWRLYSIIGMLSRRLYILHKLWTKP